MNAKQRVRKDGSKDFQKDREVNLLRGIFIRGKSECSRGY